MMLRYIAVLVVTSATAVFAQAPSDASQTLSTTTAVSSASGTASAARSTYTIKVGFPLAEHAFFPPNTVAEIGDTLTFEFLPKNHSVVQMDPKSPCIPNDMAGNEGLWWSGFYPVEKVTEPKYYNKVVDSKDPIWFYCSFPDACNRYGMIGSVNAKDPVADFATVQAAAKRKAFSLSPGEKFPGESGETPTPAATPVASTGGHSDGLSSGAIAGSTIGAVAAFALVGLLFFFVGRKKKAAELKTKPEGSDAEATAAAATPGQEQPPLYHDPRYGAMQPQSPGPEQWGDAMKAGHQSYIPDHIDHSFEANNTNRMSELPSQNFDPVEIYTPGVQAQIAGNPSTPVDNVRADTRT